ncbi:GGDEF domain-containing protein [Desulfobaculum bizertense]|uniref:sensor domain-containing diguanylate cyclase n=1 Tax=Desulfobaculum bizertense TaxID=376490 RepID=UPI001F2E68BF|nr:GGDEF domain-containing protein [Desulfobaculum bizertense]UIJ37246.1 GGDEF domain-containing protein [Desulfobaculum bizertense]
MSNVLKTVFPSARQSLDCSFPPVMSQLLAELVRPEPSFEDIARIIRLDPAITAAVLSLVNSPFYSQHGEIQDLKRAAVVLGTREILKLALSVSFLSSRESMSPRLGNAPYANWRMAVWAAIAAELIAEKIAPKVKEQAYICALLKDISLLVLANCDQALPSPEKNKDLPLCSLRHGQLEREKSEWGVTHAQLSLEMLELWGVSDLSPDCIQLHHNLEQVEELPALTQAVIFATAWAEHISDAQHAYPPAALLTLRERAKHCLELAEEDWQNLEDRCIERFRSMLSAIGLEELHPADRLYEHSVQTFKDFHIQGSEISAAQGGLLTIAQIMGRHLRWNFAIENWELALYDKSQHSWALFRYTAERGAEHIASTTKHSLLPWSAQGAAHLLRSQSQTWGSLRLSEQSLPKRGRHELSLYVWFAAEALHEYAAHQATLVRKASTFEGLPVSVAVLDKTGHVQDTNDALRSLLSLNTTPRGASLGDLLHSLNPAPFGSRWTNFLADRSRKDMSTLLCCSPDKNSAQCLHISAHKQDEGKLSLIIEDNVELSEIELQALSHGEFLEQIIDSMQELVLVLSEDGTITFASKRWNTPLFDLNFFEIARPVHDSGHHWGPAMLASLRQPVEVLFHPTGDAPLSLEFVVSELASSAQKQKKYLLVGRDLTQIRRLEKRLRQRAIVDGLTGLFNHYQFHILLEREVLRSKRSGKSIGLLFFDLDGFKEINDTRGHQAGDTVLKTVARIIRTNIRRGTDFPCRYGGDEFAIIATETDQSGLQILAHRVHNALQQHFHGALGTSMGVTMLRHNEKPNELLRRADASAYQVKAAGGNAVCWTD